MASGTVWVGLVVFTIVAGIGGWLLSKDAAANAAFADSAAALAFVGLLAVAIERIIEVWWTFVANTSRLGEWWPMKQVKTAFITYETQTNALLKEKGGVFETVTAALNTVKTAKEQAGQAVDALDGAIAEVERQRARLTLDLANAQQLAPGSSRLAMVGRVAVQTNEVLRKASDMAGAAGNEARTALDTVGHVSDRALQLIEGIKDNPARRIASILLGAGLGMVASGLMSLNMFEAVLAKEAGPIAGVIGVLLTGVVIGFGSNPTHEVVKALQHYKESKNPLDLIAAPTDEAGTEPATASALDRASVAVSEIARQRQRLVAGLEQARAAAANAQPVASIGVDPATLPTGFERRARSAAASANVGVSLDRVLQDIAADVDRIQVPERDARAQLREAGARAIRPAAPSALPAAEGRRVRGGYAIRSSE